MKRCVAFLLTFAMILSIVACGFNEPANDTADIRAELESLKKQLESVNNQKESIEGIDDNDSDLELISQYEDKINSLTTQIADLQSRLDKSESEENTDSDISDSRIENLEKLNADLLATLSAMEKEISALEDKLESQQKTDETPTIDPERIDGLEKINNELLSALNSMKADMSVLENKLSSQPETDNSEANEFNELVASINSNISSRDKDIDALKQKIESYADIIDSLNVDDSDIDSVIADLKNQLNTLKNENADLSLRVQHLLLQDYTNNNQSNNNQSNNNQYQPPVSSTPSTSVPAASVYLSSTYYQKYIGDPSWKITATVTPSNTTETGSWISTDPDLVTVDENGNVSIVATSLPENTVQTAAIIYTIGKVSASSIVILRNKESGPSTDEIQKVTDIVLSNDNINLNIGNTYAVDFAAYPSTATKSFAWTSSNESVVSVTASGVIKALKAGSAVVTVTDIVSGIFAECTVTVSDTTTPTEPTKQVIKVGVVVDAADALILGNTYSAHLTFSPELTAEQLATCSFSLSSNNGSYVKVARDDGNDFNKNSFTVVPIAQGTTYIVGFVSSTDTSLAFEPYETKVVSTLPMPSDKITNPITSISISPSKHIEMYTGTSMLVGASMTPFLNDDSLYWFSSDPSILSLYTSTFYIHSNAMNRGRQSLISSLGTSRKTGTAVLTCMAQGNSATNGVKDSIIVTVKAPGYVDKENSIIYTSSDGIFYPTTEDLGIDALMILDWTPNTVIGSDSSSIDDSCLLTLSSDGAIKVGKNVAVGTSMIGVINYVDKNGAKSKEFTIVVKEPEATDSVPVIEANVRSGSYGNYSGYFSTPYTNISSLITESTNPAIADANPSLGWFAREVGTADIMFKDQNGKVLFIIRFNVEPKPDVIPAQSITISPANVALKLGQTQKLTAILTPSDSNDRITWSSQYPSIVSVDQNGNITALQSGTVKITATTSSGKTAECIVASGITGGGSTTPEKQTIKVEVVFDETEELYVGKTYSAHLKFTPELTVEQLATCKFSLGHSGPYNRPVNIARPDGNDYTQNSFIIIPVEGGVTYLTPGVSSSDSSLTFVYTSKTIAINEPLETITNPVTSITAYEEQVTMYTGNQLHYKDLFSFTPTNNNDQFLLYSSDRSIVQCSVLSEYSYNSGRYISALKPGTAVITCRARGNNETNGVKTSVVVTVKEPGYVDKDNNVIYVTSDGVYTPKMEDLGIKYTSIPTWIPNSVLAGNGTDNSYLLSITSDGAISVGKNVPIGTSMSGVVNYYDKNYIYTNKEFKIIVKEPETNSGPAIPAESITLSYTNIHLSLGQQEKLKAILTPSDSNDRITWSSQYPQIVSVDQNGNITALQSGIVKITATTSTGKTATCTIYSGITGTPTQKIKVSVYIGATGDLKTGNAYTAYLTFSPALTQAQISTLMYAINSSDTSVANVTRPTNDFTKNSFTIVPGKDGSATLTGYVNSSDPSLAFEFEPKTVIVYSPDPYITNPITSVEVSPTTKTMYIGDSATLVASVLPVGHNDQISWSSSDDSIVKVVGSGLSAYITAVKAGTATISCKSKGNLSTNRITATCTVTVNSTGSVNFDSGIIAVSQGTTYTPTNSDIGIMGTPVIQPSWTASNILSSNITNGASLSDYILSIDVSGKITVGDNVPIGTSLSTSVRYADSSNTLVTKDFTIMVLSPKPNIDTSVPTVNISAAVGDASTLSQYSFNNATYISNQADVISVDANTGAWEALKAGTAIVSIKVDNVVVLEVKFSVDYKELKYNVSQSSTYNISSFLGSSVSGKTISGAPTSSNTSKAITTISNGSYYVTTLDTTGSVRITVSFTDGSKVYINLTIGSSGSTANPTLSATSTMVKGGNSVQLTLSNCPSYSAVTWSMTDNTGKASLSSTSSITDSKNIATVTLYTGEVESSKTIVVYANIGDETIASITITVIPNQSGSVDSNRGVIAVSQGSTYTPTNAEIGITGTPTVEPSWIESSVLASGAPSSTDSSYILSIDSTGKITVGDNVPIGTSLLSSVSYVDSSNTLVTRDFTVMVLSSKPSSSTSATTVSISAEVGDKGNLTESHSYANAVYSSNQTDVITIDANTGEWNALKPGIATVSIKVDNVIVLEVKFTVDYKKIEHMVSMSSTYNISTLLGSSFTDKTISGTPTSSNTSKAVVVVLDNNYIVTTLDTSGSVRITVSFTDGSKTYIDLTISTNSANPSLSATSTTVLGGNSVQLTLSNCPSYSTVTWSMTDNTSKASLSSTSTITDLNNKATVTLSTGTVESAKTIVVYANIGSTTVASITITVNP
ncbi:MAG: Ig-like domain-containing protein [Clostridia bacterium]|nr:Ig-like domain-containing protein [Clostridia bacterium]